MATTDVAQGLVGLCKQGKFNEAMSQYYGDDIVSVEPHGDPAELRGIQAVRKKTEWWDNNFTVHEANVAFQIDATDKTSGERSQLEEIAVYTVKDDKIVHECFFNLAS